MRHFRNSIMILLCGSLLSTSVLAAVYECEGKDSRGKQIDVTYNENAKTITVNGSVLRIESPTTDNQGVATEDYDLAEGGMAYVSLIVDTKDRIILRQRDAKTNKELSVIELACKATDSTIKQSNK